VDVEADGRRLSSSRACLKKLFLAYKVVYNRETCRSDRRRTFRKVECTSSLCNTCSSFQIVF
jgi:hypothetical protein